MKLTKEQCACMDCAVDVYEIGEYYLVHSKVWLEAVPDKKGQLCIECLEKRLGRKLNGFDFPQRFASLRLRDRMSVELYTEV